MSDKYLNEKHSVHSVQGITFGMGRASGRQGKEDLSVIPAFRELITVGRVPCDNLACGPIRRKGAKAFHPGALRSLQTGQGEQGNPAPRGSSQV